MLEFRLLELEQRESRERSPGLVRKVEAATEMDQLDTQSVKSFGLDSGCDSLTSVDDLLDTQKDFRVSWYFAICGWARPPAHIYYDLTGQFLSWLAGWLVMVGRGKLGNLATADSPRRYNLIACCFRMKKLETPRPVYIS